jgi:hypothetical protein
LDYRIIGAKATADWLVKQEAEHAEHKARVELLTTQLELKVSLYNVSFQCGLFCTHSHQAKAVHEQQEVLEQTKLAFLEQFQGVERKYETIKVCAVL